MKKQRYIITCDLKERFKQLEYLGIHVPDVEEYIGEFIESLVNLVRKSFHDNKETEITIIDIKKLASQILQVAVEKQNEFNGYIVSSCIDIAVPRRGAVLEVNRIINEKGEIIGIGPRPGHLPLYQQFWNIVNASQKRPIILVEDGIFSGSTLEYIIQKFKKYYVEIAAIVVGFGSNKGIERIKKIFPGQLIVINNLEADDLIDWMPDHDFFPFAPNCGRVLGVKINGEAYPFYNNKGASYSIPYILPFAPMEEWTSIPQHQNYPISFMCMEKAIIFFEKMDKLNGRELKVLDVLNVNPRISIPVGINTKIFPTVNEKISRFLHGIHCESW